MKRFKIKSLYLTHLTQISYRSKDKRISYHLSFLKTIRALINFPGENILFRVIDVPQAQNPFLSGAYAICIAHLLCINQNPSFSSIHFSHVLPQLINFMKTRGDLQNVLEIDEKKSGNKVLFEWIETLYCSCRQPDTWSTMKMFVQC